MIIGKATTHPSVSLILRTLNLTWNEVALVRKRSCLSIQVWDGAKSGKAHVNFPFHSKSPLLTFFSTKYVGKRIILYKIRQVLKLYTFISEKEAYIFFFLVKR